MKWAYFASGFRESRGKHTGTKANAYKVRREFQSGECCVIYCEWDDEPHKYAQDLASQWKYGDTIMLTGYSWGCGNWVKKFLWALYKANPNIIVDHVTLIDPVVRSRWPWMRWTAIMDFGTIKLPDNFDKSYIFFQRENEPNASKVTKGGKEVKLDEELFVTHTLIDNSAQVRGHVLEVAEKYLSE